MREPHTLESLVGPVALGVGMVDRVSSPLCRIHGCCCRPPASSAAAGSPSPQQPRAVRSAIDTLITPRAMWCRAALCRAGGVVQAALQRRVLAQLQGGRQ